MHGFSRAVFWPRMTTVPNFARSRTSHPHCRLKQFFSALALSFGASLLLLVLCSAVANAQSESTPAAPPPPAQDAPAAQAHPDQTAAEIASHEEATTFKVNVKLVTVRVVVRDAQGHAVGNLHKEDFELFDNRKPQVISHFAVEQPGSRAARERATSDQKAGAPSVPEHYVAFVFDDIHLKFGDLVPARLAADKYLATMQPTDRTAIFTTSGQTTLDFTDDRTKLHDTLMNLQPRPVTGTGTTECPEISYYMADLIVNKQDGQAIQAATQDALSCLPLASSPGLTNAPSPSLVEAQGMVRAESYRQLAMGSQESRIALSVLKDIVRRMSVMPGQRSMVVVSPGFLTPDTDMLSDYMDVVERALREEVVISSLDARGLYTVLPGGDISRQIPLTGFAAAVELQYQTESAQAESDILQDLADATGGAFFHNNNDLNEGFKRVSATPEYFYTLGFSPQNLKLDGGYHKLKVSLKNPSRLTLQARRGYYAPKHAADPKEEAKQEIQDAIFSQEEMHDLPVELHTQFFKSTDADAKLSVLAHVDVKDIHYRKVDGRNTNELTVVSVLFNQNGVFVQGSQKNVTMRWKDETLAKLNSGITLKTSFDVKPGSYLVRLVVRDTEGQLMSAENGAIEIP
jgi:VWFA-related protein